jgi:hypothetical protein
MFMVSCSNDQSSKRAIPSLSNPDSLIDQKDAGENIEIPTSNDVVKNVVKRKSCDGSSLEIPSYLNIETMVKLINTMKKPVTLPCLIDVLPANISINATSSKLSAQPAENEENPRLFFKFGSLILSTRTSGAGSGNLELSEFFGNEKSVKAEIALPITKNLTPEDPYKRILKDDLSGTKCAGCHFNEEPKSDQPNEYRFYSKAIRPFVRQEININTLKKYQEECKPYDNYRCQILDSIFRKLPIWFDFDEDTPTFY